jgi:CO/xanthine dehydrogenase Mo-binding subunit
MNAKKFRYIGQHILSSYFLEKITGKAVYVSDIKLPNMLYAALKRSPLPSARILKIDVSNALRIKGVRAIITGENIPKGLHGRGLLDTPILAIDVVRYVGEPVAAVAADDQETAYEAAEAINVEYERLPSVQKVEESLSEAPTYIVHPQLKSYKRLTSKLYRTKIHPTLPNVPAYQKIVTGRFEEAVKNADCIVEGSYSTSRVHHAQLEPTSIIARVDSSGILEVITSGQTPFRTRRELSDCLGIPESSIRVIVPKHVGGGFGNRGAAIYEPICAALALKTNGRPVKLTLSRMEEFSTTTTRHETKITIKDAVKANGRIIGRKIQIIYNGGAYSVAGNVAVRNAVYAISSVYDIPNLDAEIFRVYTNQVQGGAFRGFGSTQVYWAIESQMDEIADRLGIDPIDLRLRNVLINGRVSCIGETIYDDTTVDVLTAFKRAISNTPVPTPSNHSCRIGRGVALAKHQCDVTYPNIALVRVNEDSTIDLFIGSTDIGQGIFTSLAQIVAEEFKIDPSMVRIISSDTLITPVATGSSGSRQLVQMGLAVVAACRDAKNKILEQAAELTGMQKTKLILENGKICIGEDKREVLNLKELFSAGPMGGDFNKTEGIIMGKGVFYSDIAEIDPETGHASSKQVALDYTPVCACADVEVDIETGAMKVLNLLIVTDVGKAINPVMVKGQIIGGAVMGVSTTLYEQLLVKEGHVLNPTLMEYIIAGSQEAPEINFMIIESEKGPGPYGSRSIGEVPILPIAPAIGNALKKAIGSRIYSLPLDAETVYNAIKNQTSLSQ